MFADEVKGEYVIIELKSGLKAFLSFKNIKAFF